MDLISSLGISKDQFNWIFDLAKEKKEEKVHHKPLLDKTVGIAFFEPSTRTYTSFDAAAKKSGASVVGFKGADMTSTVKGESFSDTIRMLNCYSDCIVLRHKYDGSAKFASEISEVPVINAGDGKNEHPTQSLIDLFTIKERFGGIDGLSYCMMGDLKYSRTTNSLLYLLNRFNPSDVYVYSPESLGVRNEVLSKLNYKCTVLSDEDFNSTLESVDVLYVTRLQKERFTDENEYHKFKGSYRVDDETITSLGKDSIVLHALPRVDEINRKIDSSDKSMYFQQARNGVPVRMALLEMIFDGKQ
jgi:aspartate carbamoyltransferase catalytic subunit